MDLIKLFLILALASIIPGQLIRLPLGPATIMASDITVFLAVVLFFTSFLVSKKPLVVNPKLFSAFVAFTLVAAASNILALAQFSPKEIIIASLFLFRFILYFALSIVVSNLLRVRSQDSWINLLLTIGAVFLGLGFAQLLLFPDLSFLLPLGWDPHTRRIVATLLDPNFTGAVLVILINIALSYFLFSKHYIYLILSSLFFLGIVLTFSRSSYLALTTSMLIIGLAKSPKLLVAFAVIFTLLSVSVAPVRSRIVGAATLDETAQARIESWGKAITIFKDNYLFGVGFNAYRFAQSRYGFFDFDNPRGGHSGGGSDSSLLLVTATTGIVGSGIFLFFLFSIWQILVSKIKSSPVHLATTASFIGLLVHSQFVNSLFFPQIMLTFYFLVGLTQSENS